MDNDGLLIVDGLASSDNLKAFIDDVGFLFDGAIFSDLDIVFSLFYGALIVDSLGSRFLVECLEFGCFGLNLLSVATILDHQISLYKGGTGVRFGNIPIVDLVTIFTGFGDFRKRLI